METVASSKHHKNSIDRHIAFYFLDLNARKRFFFYKIRLDNFARRKFSKPFFSHCVHFISFHIAANGQNRVAWVVMSTVKSIGFFERNTLNMLRHKPNHGPTIRMFFVRHRRKMMKSIAVRFVQSSFFELFYNHFFLRIQVFFTDIQVRHTVTFEPKRTFDIFSRKNFVKIRLVSVGKSVVFAASILYRRIKIFDVFRAAKHQVFKKVRHTRLLMHFVARTDIVQHIQSRHRRTRIFVDDNTKTIF